jgi:hypothetical protein
MTLKDRERDSSGSDGRAEMSLGSANDDSSPCKWLSSLDFVDRVELESGDKDATA